MTLSSLGDSKRQTALLLFGALGGMFLMAASSATAPDVVVRDYLAASSRHDIDAALALLAEDFELQFGAGPGGPTKEQMRDILGWDAGAEGSVACSEMKVDGRKVTATCIERNRFLTLIGIPELAARNTFEVDASGRIARQRYELLAGQSDFTTAMAPAVAWAERHRPEELETLRPGGQMVFDRASAVRWLALLRAWQEETGGAE